MLKTYSKTEQDHIINAICQLNSSFDSKALLFDAQSDKPLLPYLVYEMMIDPVALAQVLAESFDVSFIKLLNPSVSKVKCDDAVLHYLFDQHLIPILLDDGIIHLAIYDPLCIRKQAELSVYLKCEIKFCFVAYDQMVGCLHAREAKKQLSQFNPLRKSRITSHIDMRTITDMIITSAIHAKASDVHLEPSIDGLTIRFRVDGLLIRYINLHHNLIKTIINRIKIMANLDISQQRLPQDGRVLFLSKYYEERELRVSICPTTCYEKIVIRILNANQKHLQFKCLGLADYDLKLIKRYIKKPQGLIVVTGPTGSGKTQTLYSMLNYINTPEKNIATIENPVEIKLKGITQVNVNYEIGLHFSTALRSFLRQDPDVIMIGEIRDRETADIAIRAAQTGHLVLSTLHTNNASDTLTRLKNMGVPSYNLIHSLSLIIAQRLVRVLCIHCKRAVNVPFHDIDVHYDSVGCDACFNGYKGRRGLFEILPVSAEVQQLIISDSVTAKLQAYLDKSRHQFLAATCLELVRDGVTSAAEYQRIIASDVV